MSDVISIAPADVRLWVSLDVHKFSIVAATLPPAGGTPEVCRIETTEKAIRRFIDRLGGPEGLAKFRKDLDAFIKETTTSKFNGESAPSERDACVRPLLPHEFRTSGL